MEKSKSIRIYFTNAEYAVIKSAAAARRMAPGKFLARCFLDQMRRNEKEFYKALLDASPDFDSRFIDLIK